MNTTLERWLRRLRILSEDDRPTSAIHGRIGETAARAHLERSGLKFLAANVRTEGSEIDLVFRDGECLVFVEVKARSKNSWTRPARAVNKAKKRRLTLAALEYLRRIHNPLIAIRFDIVEVLLDGSEVDKVRHLTNAFPMSHPYLYR